MSEIALRCQGVVKRYEDVLALDGLDLQVERGETFGLLGPNGAGKTTTVEILEGLREPNSGTVEVLGQSWGRGSRALRDRLAVQLQEAKFEEKLTVIETITLFRSFYTKGIAPREALALVGLQEKANSWVKKLSGGQKQRLSLACALACEPQVLFLDEPTTGLDPQSRLQIWDVIEAYRKRGGTVLLTTHHMEEAHRLCDRVAVVDRGKVIALGTPAELISSLGAAHVVELTADLPIDESLLAGLEGVSSINSENGSTRLAVASLHRALPGILDALRRGGCELTELRTHHATLEDVFVSLTGRHLRDD